MRVIAGRAKGHHLKPPNGMDIRPTSDRVKETIFNIIQLKIVDSVVVDLFSGTGNLGIEALSRGAKKAYFIDHSSSSISLIKENLQKTKLYSSAVVFNLDVLKGIRKLALENVFADYIFMDPPYGKDIIEEALLEIAETKLLKEGGTIIIEHDKNHVIPQEVKDIVQYRKKDFGNTSVAFYQFREGLQ